MPDIWKNNLARAPWIIGQQYEVSVYWRDSRRAHLQLPPEVEAHVGPGLVGGVVNFTNMVTPPSLAKESFLYNEVEALLKQNERNLVLGQDFPLQELVAVARSTTSGLQIQLTTRKLFNKQHAEVILCGSR